MYCCMSNVACVFTYEQWRLRLELCTFWFILQIAANPCMIDLTRYRFQKISGIEPQTLKGKVQQVPTFHVLYQLLCLLL